jgi:hypothetical protein
METMEGLSEQYEALENQIHAVKRRLHCWRGIVCGQTRRRPRRAHCSATLLLAALVVYALAPVRPGQAADFSCTAGDVACLITAINMANANGQANTITLKAGTYTLTAVDNFTDVGNGLPVVTSPLTIKGRDAETTIIDGAGHGRILNVAATGTLTLQRLTLRNGFTGASVGGGIFNNSGTLTLIDSILNRNRASACAGLLNNNGTVTIIHTTFDGNETIFNFPGGGLCNGFSLGANPPIFEGGTVTIANSTFVHNIADNAGGLFNRGTMTLTNTTVAQNVAVLRGGGGILNVDDGILLLQNTTVAENHALNGVVGGIGGNVILQNSIIARNDTEPPPFSGPIVPFDFDCTSVTSLGNNLIGDLRGCTITLQPTDLTGDPGLGTFTNNGTPGNGHFPLLSTSQAIDAGNNAVCFQRDQLGRRRVGPCDIGAISFRFKDDSRHEEKDDHQHGEDLVSGVQGSR